MLYKRYLSWIGLLDELYDPELDHALTHASDFRALC